MKKSSENTVFTAIGLMSGTAMDGIDAALIKTDGHARVERLDFISDDFDADLRAQLKSCLNQTAKNAAVEDAFTVAQIPVIQKLLQQNNLSSGDIDVIGFHGQTIHHDPDQGITVQLGNGDLLAAETGIDTVYDFRSQDMRHGGQGAPFLPVYHQALVKNAALELPVTVINIGGVGNITWMSDDKIIAFDTGPGNALIDDYIAANTDQSFDKDGKIAARGLIDQEAVDQFLLHPYFAKSYPKSVDRNDFHAVSVVHLTLENAVATLTAMTVQSIAKGIDQCPLRPMAIYVTGGGRKNLTIMRSLQEMLGIPVRSVDDLGWNGDAMEAEGFAYMAVRHLINEPISFPTTTACSKPTVGGVLASATTKAYKVVS